eukprot:Hpha_TRINITY_DN9329_c0_g1::TRINITY_DN9329_c0_g1_i1::g.26001::m.26001/K10643/CNOT4, NOT4, MOT2; CCR4-NOT transcription complex subunit 4
MGGRRPLSDAMPRSGASDGGSDCGEECLICTDPITDADMGFLPCACGFRICVWCYHKLKDECTDSETFKCPGCRAVYDPAVVLSMPQPAAHKPKRRQQPQGQQQATKRPDRPEQRGQAAGGGGNRRELEGLRVVQRTLVYAVGFPKAVAKEDMLRGSGFFGQYGKIVKLAISKSSLQQVTATVHVTFQRAEQAALCLRCVDGAWCDGRQIRATFGANKYCPFFLKSRPCNSSGCSFLHALARAEDHKSAQDEELNPQSGKPRLRFPQEHRMRQALPSLDEVMRLEKEQGLVIPRRPGQSEGGVGLMGRADSDIAVAPTPNQTPAPSAASMRKPGRSWASVVQQSTKPGGPSPSSPIVPPGAAPPAAAEPPAREKEKSTSPRSPGVREERESRPPPQPAQLQQQQQPAMQQQQRQPPPSASKRVYRAPGTLDEAPAMAISQEEYIARKGERDARDAHYREIMKEWIHLMVAAPPRTAAPVEPPAPADHQVEQGRSPLREARTSSPSIQHPFASHTDSAQLPWGEQSGLTPVPSVDDVARLLAQIPLQQTQQHPQLHRQSGSPPQQQPQHNHQLKQQNHPHIAATTSSVPSAQRTGLDGGGWADEPYAVGSGRVVSDWSPGHEQAVAHSSAERHAVEQKRTRPQANGDWGTRQDRGGAEGGKGKDWSRPRAGGHPTGEEDWEGGGGPPAPANATAAADAGWSGSPPPPRRPEHWSGEGRQQHWGGSAGGRGGQRDAREASADGWTEPQHGRGGGCDGWAPQGRGGYDDDDWGGWGGNWGRGRGWDGEEGGRRGGGGRSGGQ